LLDPGKRNPNEKNRGFDPRASSIGGLAYKLRDGEENLV
jgi:hypothetical protein